MGLGTHQINRRSWRNLLLNRSYQLRFTLFMVGVTGLLLAGLGLWVLSVAGSATEVGKTQVRGIPCPDRPVITGETKPPAPPSAKGTRTGRDDRVIEVTTSLRFPAAHQGGAGISPDFFGQLIEYYSCRLEQAARIERLEAGRRLIRWVLLALGALLLVGLTIYGIKMTHRVAGPLHKIGRYLAQMREGRYGPVYDLRRGDYLIEFYDQFKAAHAGMRRLQEQDIECYRDFLAIAADAGLAERSPELRAALEDLHDALKGKEESLA